MSNLGYDDTMYISGNPYRVHDNSRPQPRIVTPGTHPGDAPSDAVTLFDGTNLSQWTQLDGSEPGWLVENGYMEVVPKTGNIKTKAEFGDCQLHLEFASPVEVKGESQGRGNSGVFLMGQYEIQVLDNYDNPTYADGLCGSLYGQCPPLVNACREPGAWSSYDIVWEGPVFDGEKLIKPAYVTIMLNGIILHNRKALLGPTQHRVTTQYKPHVKTGPIMLQDHGDKVRFRNIWVRPLTDYDQP
jgi:hypothetical protein